MRRSFSSGLDESRSSRSGRSLGRRMRHLRPFQLRILSRFNGTRSLSTHSGRKHPFRRFGRSFPPSSPGSRSRPPWIFGASPRRRFSTHLIYLLDPGLGRSLSVSRQRRTNLRRVVDSRMVQDSSPLRSRLNPLASNPLHRQVTYRSHSRHLERRAVRVHPWPQDLPRRGRSNRYFVLPSTATAAE